MIDFFLIFVNALRQCKMRSKNCNYLFIIRTLPYTCGFTTHCGSFYAFRNGDIYQLKFGTSNKMFRFP